MNFGYSEYSNKISERNHMNETLEKEFYMFFLIIDKLIFNQILFNQTEHKDEYVLINYKLGNISVKTSPHSSLEYWGSGKLPKYMLWDPKDNYAHFF